MTKAHKICALFVGAYLVDTLFSLVDWDYTHTYSFFPFFHGNGTWDGRISLSYYVYNYCQFVQIMMLLYAGYLASGIVIFKIGFWLETLDLLDYACCYSYTWFTVGGIDVEFTYVKLIAFLYLTHKSYGSS